MGVKRNDDLTDRLIEQAQDVFGVVLHQQASRITDIVESPIEHAFFLSFIANMQAYGLPWLWAEDRSIAQRDVLLNETTTVIVPQCAIDDYRVDFLIVTRRGSTGAVEEFVVECDGHDFHERTKEQAERDKGRDRKLQSLGLPVFRFTGSEIFRDPIRKAAEICEHALRIIQDRDP
jgi:very-short-patch-repair endonuclease